MIQLKIFNYYNILKINSLELLWNHIIVILISSKSFKFSKLLGDREIQWSIWVYNFNNISFFAKNILVDFKYLMQN